MSDSDSFINEVTEEVRRDQLYRYLRRYGWIAVVCVLVLVGGAAWNEYNKAQSRAAAEATGDAMLAALAQDDPEARAVALLEIEGEGVAAAVTELMTAASQQEAGQPDAAKATLEGLAVNGDVPDVYRDLAAIKAAMIDTGEDPATRRATLENLAQPGATFALLAQEQLAYLDVAAGETEAAMARLRQISEDAGATRGLRERVQTLIVSLGGEVETAPATQEVSE